MPGRLRGGHGGGPTAASPIRGRRRASDGGETVDVLFDDLLCEGVDDGEPSPTCLDVYILPEPWPCCFEEPGGSACDGRDCLEVSLEWRGRWVKVANNVGGRSCSCGLGSGLWPWVVGRRDEGCDVGQDVEGERGVLHAMCEEVCCCSLPAAHKICCKYTTCHHLARPPPP